MVAKTKPERAEWLYAEEARGLAGLDAAPELLFRCEQQVLVERRPE
jgi:hypothetical protein